MSFHFSPLGVDYSTRPISRVFRSRSRYFGAVYTSALGLGLGVPDGGVMAHVLLGDVVWFFGSDYTEASFNGLRVVEHLRSALQGPF